MNDKISLLQLIKSVILNEFIAYTFIIFFFKIIIKLIKDLSKFGVFLKNINFFA